MSTAPDVKKQSDSAVRNPLWETNESRRLFHDDTALGTKSGDEVERLQNEMHSSLNKGIGSVLTPISACGP